MPPKIGGAAANKAAPKGMTPAEKKKQKIDNKAKANPGAAAANKEKSDAKRARSASLYLSLSFSLYSFQPLSPSSFICLMACLLCS
jgi:hypothetical protein